MCFHAAFPSLYCGSLISFQLTYPQARVFNKNEGSGVGKKKLQNKIKSETKKLGQIGEDFFFFLLFFGSLERTVVFGYLSLSLFSPSVCQCLSVSLRFYRDYFILFAAALAALAMGLRRLLWTNPPQSQ